MELYQQKQHIFATQWWQRAESALISIINELLGAERVFGAAAHTTHTQKHEAIRWNRGRRQHDHRRKKSLI